MQTNVTMSFQYKQQFCYNFSGFLAKSSFSPEIWLYLQQNCFIMSLTSAVPVITLWEEFLQHKKTGDVQEFARWIIKEIGNDLQPHEKKGSAVKSQSNAGPGLGETEKVLLHLYRLSRIVELKCKPIIKKIGFAKPQEYAMLGDICLLKNPNKKEIGEKMLIENSTAVEISNRLVERGFVKEFTDPDDKRSTRLSVTDKGMKKLYESYHAITKVRESFLDCFNAREREVLVKLLQQLDKYQSISLKEESNP